MPLNHRLSSSNNETLISAPFTPLEWSITAPPSSDLGDHDVPVASDKLQGKTVALMISGGIAAMKAPLISRALRKAGATVTIFASQEALRYVTIDTLEWSSNQAVITSLSARAEHLGDGRSFDAYLVAPATYNTINKFAAGVADGLITTTLASALGKQERGSTQILIAPTMHGTMHNSILQGSLEGLRYRGVHLIQPRAGYGKHNIPSEESLVNEVSRATSRSPLKGKGILVTGGPTPVKVDDVRRLTNKFTGRLSMAISEELHARGAEVRLLLGAGSVTPSSELAPYVEWVEDYQQYRSRALELSASPRCWAGIYSAAVADYELRERASGKIESGHDHLQLSLIPTAKVIDEIRAVAPSLHMLTFKYQEGVSHQRLMEIAARRLHRFEAVFANRGEEKGAQGEQVGWLCRRENDPLRLVGKSGIARGIADDLERHCSPDVKRAP